MPRSGDPLFDLEGRAILVAGGAGGLGLPLAQALSARGARLTIADIDAQAARRVADELAAGGAEATSFRLDVRDGGSCAAAVAATAERWGRLDGLLNASGIYRIGPALELADEAWEDTIAINLSGAFRLATTSPIPSPWGAPGCTADAAGGGSGAAGGSTDAVA